MRKIEKTKKKPKKLRSKIIMETNNIKNIFRSDGRYLGFIKDDFLYSRDGIYLGWIEGQIAWDKNGNFRGVLIDKYILLDKYTIPPTTRTPKISPNVMAPTNPPANIPPVNPPTGLIDGFLD